MMIHEVIPRFRVIWQSDAAKSYRCPDCGEWIRSQYEGEQIPTVTHGEAVHILEWPMLISLSVRLDKTLCAPGEVWLETPDGDAERVWPPPDREDE